jgi:hypothetical protein
MSSEGPTKRFGWIIPQPAIGVGGMNIHVIDQPLSDAVWTEYDLIVGRFTELRPFIIDYLSLEQAFDVLNGLDQHICDALGSATKHSPIPGEALIRAYSTAQSAVSNFLFAASTFRDRSTIRLAEICRENPEGCELFQTEQRKAYDASFAYRLLYNLRNFAQHHDSPLEMIPVQGKRDSSNQMKLSIRIELQRDILLKKGKKIQPRVLKKSPTNPKPSL